MREGTHSRSRPHHLHLNLSLCPYLPLSTSPPSMGVCRLVRQNRSMKERHEIHPQWRHCSDEPFSGNMQRTFCRFVRAFSSEATSRWVPTRVVIFAMIMCGQNGVLGRVQQRWDGDLLENFYRLTHLHGEVTGVRIHFRAPLPCIPCFHHQHTTYRHVRLQSGSRHCRITGLSARPDCPLP